MTMEPTIQQIKDAVEDVISKSIQIIKDGYEEGVQLEPVVLFMLYVAQDNTFDFVPVPKGEVFFTQPEFKAHLRGYVDVAYQALKATPQEGPDGPVEFELKAVITMSDMYISKQAIDGPHVPASADPGRSEAIGFMVSLESEDYLKVFPYEKREGKMEFLQDMLVGGPGSSALEGNLTKLFPSSARGLKPIASDN